MVQSLPAYSQYPSPYGVNPQAGQPVAMLPQGQGMPPNQTIPAGFQIGQNPNMTGTNPTTQFNQTATSALQMYADMGFDKSSQALLGVANNFLDPTKVSYGLGLQPQTLTQGTGGYTMATTRMSGMTQNSVVMALKAALQTDPKTGNIKDKDGFLVLMGKALEGGASDNPEIQQLIPIYQQLSAQAPAVGAATTSGVATAGATTAQNPQLEELKKQNEVLMALLKKSGSISDEDLKQLMTPTATASASTATTTPSTTQQQTQALLRKRINPTA